MEKILIVGINGSPRKNGNTAKLLKRVLKSVEKNGGKTILIHLIDKNIKPCLGCYSTNPKNCRYPYVQKDDMQEIYKLLLKADGVVLASPSYWFNVSGLMKNFLDRIIAPENNGYKFKGKVAGCVATAEESGSDEVANYLTAVLNEMGFLIPPFATAFFDTKYKGSWYLGDLDLLGKNMVKLCKVLKKEKVKFKTFLTAKRMI